MARDQPSHDGSSEEDGRVGVAGDVECSHHDRGGDDGRVDRTISQLAARQHGRVARWQLLEAGVRREAIRHRVEASRLHLLHRGVYAVGYVAPTPYGDDMGAVLACGPGAVLSHRSAAVLWGLLRAVDRPPEVTIPRARRVVRPGITVHRTDHLPPPDVRHHHGIPVTSPTRTLLDLAATAPDELDRALNEAVLRRLTDPAVLLTRAVNRPGARALKAALTDGPAPTRSDPERKLLALVKAADLPRPQTNIRIGGFEVDAVWLPQRVVAEVDGYAFHSNRAAFENDRRRDAQLQAAGFRVLRFTWRQLTARPERVIAQLAATLSR